MRQIALHVADLCPYWTYPPTGGGPLRVYNMNRCTASYARVSQFSARPTFGHTIAGGRHWLFSRVVQPSEQYIEYQYSNPLLLASGYALYRLGLHSDLLLSPVLRALSPRMLRSALSDADVIQVEHPWMFRLALTLAGNRPLVYVAHNVEACLWKESSSGLPALKRFLARRTRELEREAVTHAHSVIAMSIADAAILEREYGVDKNRLTIIPNGVDTQKRRPPTRAERAEARAKLGLDGRPVLLFMGTDHYPNREAVSHIARWQAELGPRLNVLFLVVGDVGRGLRSTEFMRITGMVSDVSDYLAASDIGLNPLLSGSGTSLKVVEYLACGLATVSTKVGIRGLELRPDSDVAIGDVEEFPSIIERLLADRRTMDRLSVSGRVAVEQQYSWEQLSRRLLVVYEEVTSCVSV